MKPQSNQGTHCEDYCVLKFYDIQSGNKKYIRKYEDLTLSSTQDVTFPTNQKECLRFDYKSLAQKMVWRHEEAALRKTGSSLHRTRNTACYIYTYHITANLEIYSGTHHSLTAGKYATCDQTRAVQHFVQRQCKGLSYITHKYIYYAKFMY
jgi:hypothetical protein